jgi:hypothetical protein
MMPQTLFALTPYRAVGFLGDRNDQSCEKANATEMGGIEAGVRWTSFSGTVETWPTGRNRFHDD